MRVKVLLFAGLRDIVGKSELESEVPDAATIGDVWTALVTTYPDLAKYGASLSCAHNEEYAPRTAAVSDGDEVAFLPPVSGGYDGHIARKRRV
jgi:molybdopterin converting factor subunit 1